MLRVRVKYLGALESQLRLDLVTIDDHVATAQDVLEAAEGYVVVVDDGRILSIQVLRHLRHVATRRPLFVERVALGDGRAARNPMVSARRLRINIHRHGLLHLGFGLSVGHKAAHAHLRRRETLEALLV